MIEGILIPMDTSAPVELRQFAPGEIRKAVGGIVKGIDLPSLAARICMNADPLEAPFNARATFLWAHHRPKDRLNALVGGASVLVGIAGEDCDTPDVPERVRQLLLKPNTFRTVARLRRDSRWHGDYVRFPDYWGAISWAMMQQDNWPKLKEMHVLLASEVQDPPD